MNKQIVRRFQEFAQANGIALDLEQIDFELVSLKHNDFKFVKGLNKYIRKSVEANPGEIPVVGASLDNEGIYSHVTPLDKKDVISEISVSYNKDNARGSRAFYRDYPFIMDRHHLAIIPNQSNIFPKYLFHFLNLFLKEKNFGWGDNVATVEAVQEAEFPLPKPSQGFSSLQIQEILVRFIEHGQSAHQRRLDGCAIIRPILDKMERSVVPRTLEKSRGARKLIKEFLQENGIELDYEKVEFETFRIHSDDPKELVCSKRMGFTPTRDPEGNVNWFTVADLNSFKDLTIKNPITKEKTSLEKVKKAVGEKSIKFKSIERGDVLVSFKLTVGVTKIYDSDEIAYCNEAIDILTPNEKVTSEYLALNCMVEYPKYGSITNNGKTLNDDHKKEIEIKVPKDLEQLSSIQIQEILVDFISNYLNRVNHNRRVADKLERQIAEYRETYLKLFFKSLKQKAHAD